MEEESKTIGGNKWYSRLALLFAILFAMFWSLGAFFFWILLGLTASFGALALFASGFSMPSFNRPSNPANPYLSNPSPSPALPSDAENLGPLVRKVIRFIIVGFASLFLFLFVIGTLFEDDIDSAAEQSREIITDLVENDDANAWNDKGNESFSRANYDSALFYYEKALAADPQNQYALYNRALVFSNIKDYRKSNNMARRCLQLHPDYDPAWWLLGYNFSNMSQNDSAIYCLEKAYNNGFDDPNFLELMAEVYLKQSDRKRSTEFYLLVLSKDSSKVSAYEKLAELDPQNSAWYRQKASDLEQGQ